ncbi:NAD(P)H-hydrate dehydratase [Desulfurococcus amylolyticus]|uniref:Bifunctional NAD(P)H-hydrate repair enzyme n=1 Tax=Desulfurococcus amylolyticus DSM 16532 TaxID=768672 RepID=I3XQY0_DESAM|nr:carbohydrate kinase, YjeF related protein [Desulfurococcus amylolyticus DSM 16532]
MWCPLLKICSVSEMRWIDEEAQKYGLSSIILMEEAGSALYTVILREYGVEGKRFTVIAGTGNNGGDALAAARRLHAGGGFVEVFIAGNPVKMSEAARTNHDILVKMGIPVKYVSSEEEVSALEESIKRADVFLVGLIGIGLRGEVSGLPRRIIELVNSSGKPVVSVDIPSGVEGDTGLVRGVAVKSSITVAFGMPKYGNILYPGYHYCGKLYVSMLSYPRRIIESVRAELNTPVKLPERPRWGHKGVFGKLLAVAGARYYYGAPYYVSLSFLKVGGGYSRLAAPKSIIPYIASRAHEVVYIPLEETSEGTIALGNLEKILGVIEEHSIDIVAVGPGVSLNNETQELVRELVESIDKPVIIDGDGITAVSGNPDVVKKRKAPTIVTPHPAEFSRLVNKPLKEVQENPVEYLRKACIELGSYIVYKGAHSMICYPDGYIYVNMTGNPGMAKAGSGDVLTGAIAGMYGIGLRNIGEAVRMGVLVHGLAGDLAAEDMGEDGVTPDTIMEYLPKAVKVLRENPGLIVDKYMPKQV